MITETLSLPATELFPLQVLATRYRTADVSVPEILEDGYTLVCMHAVGLHKETWQAVARHLLSSITKDSVGRPHYLGHIIREIYAIECPNHGESALVNKEILQTRYKDTWSIRDYTRAAHAFLSAGASRGTCVDFAKRKLIGIGHCFGALALLFMHEMAPRIKFESFILFEPGVVPHADYPDYREVFKRYQAWVWLRREVWPSRKAAREELSGKAFFSGWDSESLDLFIKHAIIDHPASQYPPPYTFTGVTYSTSKENETASYRAPEFVGDSLHGYVVTAKENKMHLIWGEIDDVLPGHLKNNVTNHTDVGSVTWVQGAGHLIIQQKPGVVAHRISSCLELMVPVKAAL